MNPITTDTDQVAADFVAETWIAARSRNSPNAQQAALEDALGTTMQLLIDLAHQEPAVRNAMRARVAMMRRKRNAEPLELALDPAL